MATPQCTPRSSRPPRPNGLFETQFEPVGDRRPDAPPSTEPPNPGLGQDRHRVGNSAPTGESPFLTVPEISRLLRVPCSLVYEWTRTRAIPCYQAGKRLLFDWAEVLTWYKQTYRREGLYPGARRVRRAALRTERSNLRRGRNGLAVPLSPTTINYTLSVLKFILKDAAEHGYLTENTAAKVKPLRGGHKDDDDLHFLRPDQIELLTEVAEEPYRMLYLIAVNTGLRRGEVLGLHWQDVDLSRKLLYVRRSLGRIREGNRYVVREMAVKTRHSRRTIDLSPAVVAALLVHRTSGDSHTDYVFRSRVGGPIDPSDLNRVFRRHLALAGLPHIRFHDLRHTHASLLIEAGVHPKAIQVRMGHASITTTLNTYGHLMPSAFQGSARSLTLSSKAMGRNRAG